MTLFNSKELFFVLLVLFCGNYVTKARNQSEPDIRGKITKINRYDSARQSNKLTGSILVERDPNESGKHDKADVKITNESRIFTRTDKAKSSPLKIGALELNQRVEVRFTTDPALLTYPIQAGAAEIIILSGSKETFSTSLSNAAPQNSNPEMIKLLREIDAGNAVWVAAWAKGAPTLLPETFTTDGKELLSGGKIFKGRRQILALMRDSMRKRGGKAKLTVTTTDVWLDGNTAYETGTAVYEFTVEGQPQTLERRYFTVWKRPSKSGAWKIYSNTGIAK